MASQYSLLRNYGKYISPYNIDLMAQGMGYLQQKVDTNRQMINDYVDYVINQDIIKPQDREYLQNRLNGIIQDVNNVYRGSNLSSDGIARSIQSRLGEALDTRVMNAIAGTREIRNFSEKMEDMKLNNPKMYSPVNEGEAFAEAVEWMNDGQVGTRLNPIHYTPYTDYHAEIDKKMKEFISLNKGKTIQIPVTDANGNRTGEMRELHVDEMSYAQVRDIAMASISENGKAQMQLEGRYMARTNPQIFNKTSTQQFLQGYMRDFDIKEDSIKAELKGAGNDKVKKARLEEELRDITRQRRDFEEEAAAFIGRDYDPARAGMFMVRQQFLRGVGLRWSYNNSYETRGVDDYYFKANQQLLDRAEFDETKRHNREMERAAILRAERTGKGKSGDGSDNDTPEQPATVSTKPLTLGDVSLGNKLVEGFGKNEKEMAASMTKFMSKLSPKAKKEISAWVSDPKNEDMVRNMDDTQKAMTYFKLNGGAQNGLLDPETGSLYLSLLSGNDKRIKYDKVNSGFTNTENMVLDGVDGIVSRSVESDPDIDVSYGYGSFNLGDIKNGGDLAIDEEGIRDITLKDWAKLSAYSSILSNSVKATRTTGPLEAVVTGRAVAGPEVDSGDASVVISRINNLMGTSLTLEDINAIASMPITDDTSRNKKVGFLRNALSNGDKRNVMVAMAIHDEIQKEQNDLFRHKWSRGDLGQLARDMKRAGDDYLKDHYHEFAEQEWTFSGDYPAKSQGEKDYINVSNLFTTGGGVAPKDKDDANKKTVFTITPVGAGRYAIFANGVREGKSVVEVSEADLAANNLTFYKESNEIPSDTYSSGTRTISFPDAGNDSYGELAESMGLLPYAYTSGARRMLMPLVEGFSNAEDNNSRKTQMSIATDVLLDNASMYELRADGYRYDNGMSGVKVRVYRSGGYDDGESPLYVTNIKGAKFADEVARKVNFCPQYFLIQAWMEILTKERDVYYQSDGMSTTDDFENFVTPIKSMINQRIRLMNDENGKQQQ